MESSIAEFLARQSASEQLPRPWFRCPMISLSFLAHLQMYENELRKLCAPLEASPRIELRTFI